MVGGKSEASPYVPSYAGLIRFKEEKAKIAIKPKILYLVVLLFAVTVLTLHLFYS